MNDKGQYKPGTIVWYWGDLACRFEPDAELPSPVEQLTPWQLEMLRASLHRVTSEVLKADALRHHHEVATRGKGAGA